MRLDLTAERRNDRQSSPAFILPLDLIDRGHARRIEAMATVMHRNFERSIVPVQLDAERARSVATDISEQLTDDLVGCLDVLFSIGCLREMRADRFPAGP
jgi:hypothetical protein